MSALTIPEAVTIDDDAPAFDAYQTAVDAELERLRSLGNYQKRRNTVWHLAWSAVTPQVSQNSVFERPDVVSRSIFYSKWRKQPEFTAVLDRVTEMTRTYIEGKEGRRLDRLRAQLVKMETETSFSLFDKAKAMLEWPTKVIEQQTEEDNGRIIYKTVILPTNWSQRDAAVLTKTGSDIGRRALGMDGEEDKSEKRQKITYIEEKRP